MRFLFVIRSAPDLERFSAIAPHLAGETLVFTDVGSGAPIDAPLHLKLLGRARHEVQPWWRLAKVPLEAPRPLLASEASKLLDAVQPDLVVVDQFGPSAPTSVVACRDAALRMGIPCCMIPHGVQVVWRRGLAPRLHRGHPIANAVFYTSDAHRASASWYFEHPGTWWRVLGDPRFDTAHLRLLQEIAASEGYDLSPLGSGSLAWFGSRLSSELTDRLFELGSLDPDTAFAERLRTKWDPILMRPHPRLASSELQLRPESIVISSRVSTVAGLVSSSVLEGLALGTPAIVLDAARLGPSWQTLFLEESSPYSADRDLPLRVVVPTDDLLRRSAWGGMDGTQVAATYANCLRALAAGDPATAFYVA